MTWHEHIRLEVERETAQASTWERMELEPRAVRRPFGLPHDVSLSVIARRIRNARYKASVKGQAAQRRARERYAQSDKGRATIQAYTHSENGKANARARDKRRRDKRS
jgi:hypothetical protein